MGMRIRLVETSVHTVEKINCMMKIHSLFFSNNFMNKPKVIRMNSSHRFALITEVNPSLHEFLFFDQKNLHVSTLHDEGKIIL